jgi:hypothetical protein
VAFWRRHHCTHVLGLTTLGGAEPFSVLYGEEICLYAEVFGYAGGYLEHWWKNERSKESLYLARGKGDLTMGFLR